MNGDSDSYNNNKNDGGSENRAFRLQVEAVLAQRFAKAMVTRINQLQVTNAQDFKLSTHEQKALMNVVTANLLEGAAAGVITFFILRRLNMEYFKHLKRSYSEQNATIRRPTMPDAFSSPYQQVPTTQQTTNITNMMKNAAEKASSSGDGAGRSFGSARLMVNATSIIFDGIVSCYVAVFVSTRNRDPLLQQLSDLPLLEGESIVSKELCPIFTNELKSIYQDLAHDNNNRNSPTLPKFSAKNKVFVRDAIADPQTPQLLFYINFCTNCRRRAAYENILREQSGLSSDAVISIPPPGVPQTFDVTNDIAFASSLDSDPFSTEAASDMHNNSNFDDNTTTSSNDWTEPFVTDHEEEKRRK